jgi:hypothetical protein
LWQNSIPLHPSAMIFTHSSADRHVSISWLLQITLQWTWQYRCLFDIQSLYPLDVYQVVGLLDQNKIPTLGSMDKALCCFM